LACALYSARTGLALPADLAIAGELSLTGEIRPVRRLVGRVKTAVNLGYNSFLGPTPDLTTHERSGKTRQEANSAIQGLHAAENIKTAIKLIFDVPGKQD
jgi:DNA repair protein RadA/Sms